MKKNLMRFAGAGALALVFSVGAATVQAAPTFAGQGYGQGPGRMGSASGQLPQRCDAAGIPRRHRGSAEGRRESSSTECEQSR